MTSLPARLRQWLDSPTVIYECRNCGRSLDDEQASCPECESTGTVCYTVE